MDGDPLIINLALTGMVPRRSDNPHVPLTPAEICEDVARCFAVGARVFHVHARNADESPAYEREIFAEIIAGIRQSTPEAIICVTTSGRQLNTFESRSEVLSLQGDLKPDMASLTLGSLNFPKQASVTDPDMIRRLAGAMHEAGIVPELEIFDMGMLDYAHYLIGRNILRPPYVCNLLLGSLGTLMATPLNLALLVERLPPGALWSAAGIGRYQFPMNALGIVSGGHVRTGLEDNLYMDRAKREPATNLRLVERLVTLAAASGRRVATPAETRARIGVHT
jgi:uncharacterized protein (DUF849 family)